MELGLSLFEWWLDLSGNSKIFLDLHYFLSKIKLFWYEMTHKILNFMSFLLIRSSKFFSSCIFFMSSNSVKIISPLLFRTIFFFVNYCRKSFQLYWNEKISFSKIWVFLTLKKMPWNLKLETFLREFKESAYL